VAAQVLRQRRDRTAVLDLLAFFDWLGDSNLAQIVRGMPPLPCRPSCAFCCYVGPERPDLLAPELLRIVDHVRQERSAETMAMVQERLQDDAYASRADKPPCLFLEHDRCTIYPVRPMRCRAQHSHDREACERHYLGKQLTMPLLREPAMLYKSMQVGLRLGLRQESLEDVRLPMDGGLRIALSDPDPAVDRWLGGESLFGTVALPEEADERRLLTQMQGQARGEMRAETARLARLITTLVDQPGSWALYPLTGRTPLA
jgi:Fe-S-cluster containining protein